MYMTITHNFTGSSLAELKAKFGVGKNGFYKQDWYESEPFWNKKPPAGKYEIQLRDDLNNKTLDEQKKECPKGWEATHPAVVMEAVLANNKSNEDKLLEDWWVNTSSRSSVGGLVRVGGFGADGAHVDGWYPGHSADYLGVSFSRRIDTLNLEPLKLSEIKITEIEYQGNRYRLVDL